MLAGLEDPTSGTISLAGTDVTDSSASERDVGFVFQFYALYPHMTARQNIDFPLSCENVEADERKARVQVVINRLQLGSLADAHPLQLRGGDQQRVALEDALTMPSSARRPGEIRAMPYRWRREDYGRILAERHGGMSAGA